MYINYNPNPKQKRVGDCVIRAICKATDQEWEKVYMQVCLEGLKMCDMPSSNPVWGSYLKSKGFLLDEHMDVIKLLFPKEYREVIRLIEEG